MTVKFEFAEFEPRTLPTTLATSEHFLPFIRLVEKLALESKACPVLVYWSRHSAAKLIPHGSRYRQLMRDTFCVSIFSEERGDPPEEWIVLLDSEILSVVVCGQSAMEFADYEHYNCSGSLEPEDVQYAYERLFPIWKFIDLTEAQRVDQARSKLRRRNSKLELVDQLRSAWDTMIPQSFPFFKTFDN